MKTLKGVLTIIILACVTACESPPPSDALPTLYQLPTAQIAALIATPTARPLRAVSERPTLPSPMPTIAPVTPTPITAANDLGIITATPAFIAAAPTQTSVSPAARPVLPAAFVFGKSAGGRDLNARRFGDGATLLMLVGAVHGGWETNTSELMQQLIAHFDTTPGDVLPGITLVIVPTLNPDGAALGRVLEGRFNGNGVDLNRNWDCGWKPTAYFQSREVNPGSAPMSEPETQALAALIHDLRPGAVLLYHSAADGIFAGGCEELTPLVETGEQLSDQMAVVLGRATGYSYGLDFTSYPVSGTAPAWIATLGIASADVELATWRESEFERNLRGAIAVQCWLLGADAGRIPACLTP